MPCKNGGTCIMNESAVNRSNSADNWKFYPRQYRGMSSMGAPVSPRTIESKDNYTLSSTIKTENDFVCNCPAGWTGATCEISKSALVYSSYTIITIN